MKLAPLNPSLCASLLLLCLAGSCKEEVFTPEARPLLEQYFPLELNRPAYYQVDSVVLRAVVGGITYDSSRSEVRETLVETFTAADGTTVYRGERWVRRDDTQPFRFEQTFTVSRDARAATRSEGNLTFTKLTAPIREGSSWDGNAAFDERRSVRVGGEFLDVYQGWEYRYTDLDGLDTLKAGTELDSVVTVTQAEILDLLIDLRVAYERYAPGLGLVERFVDARHTQCISCCNRNTEACSPLPWDEKAEKGYIIREELIRRD
ncbi:hypothetical protein [Neolewinella sp.]|uniref:hypothetical protein n=1 Tax=Neolewinella sp. TaxID=2993543 RepID=UPI003B52BDD6